MLPLKVNFLGMKKQASTKIKLLEKAQTGPDVVRAIKALKRVIDILEVGCGGMGFMIKFPSKPLQSPRRRPVKQTSRA
jgi:hypothetical protein